MDSTAQSNSNYNNNAISGFGGGYNSSNAGTSNSNFSNNYKVPDNNNQSPPKYNAQNSNSGFDISGDDAIPHGQFKTDAFNRLDVDDLFDQKVEDGFNKVANNGQNDLKPTADDVGPEFTTNSSVVWADPLGYQGTTKPSSDQSSHTQVQPRTNVGQLGSSFSSVMPQDAINKPASLSELLKEELKADIQEVTKSQPEKDDKNPGSFDNFTLESSTTKDFQSPVGLTHGYVPEAVSPSLPSSNVSDFNVQVVQETNYESTDSKGEGLAEVVTGGPVVEDVINFKVEDRQTPVDTYKTAVEIPVTEKPSNEVVGGGGSADYSTPANFALYEQEQSTSPIATEEAKRTVESMWTKLSNEHKTQTNLMKVEETSDDLVTVDTDTTKALVANKNVVMYSLFGFFMALILLGIGYLGFFGGKGQNTNNGGNSRAQEKVGGALTKPLSKDTEKQKLASNAAKEQENVLGKQSEEKINAVVEDKTMSESTEDESEGISPTKPEVEDTSAVNKDIDIETTFIPKEVLDGMKIYKSTDLGFKFMVPSGWTSCKSESSISENSLTFYDSDVCPGEKDKNIMSISYNTEPISSMYETEKILDTKEDYNDTGFTMYLVNTPEDDTQERIMQVSTDGSAGYITVLFPKSASEETIDEIVATFDLL
jgi:hypothetical protein